MANPTLHWRMLAPVFVQNATTSGFMDALYQMGTATTYADGTARVPGTFATPGTASLPATLGTGSAWTWNFDNTTYSTGVPGGPKTAVYGYAPTSTAINQAVVICGAASVAAPPAVWKQLSADTRSGNYLYIGLAKNSGTYTSWNNATTPFSAGDFTGLGYISSGANLYAYIYMWECEEAIAIQVLNSTNASGGFAGAFVDPLSVTAASAETDGRLYGVSTSGSGSYLGANSLSVTAAASGPMFYNFGTTGDTHFSTFTPGAGTLTATFRFGNFSPGLSFTSRNGDLPQIPIQTWTGTQYVGQLRQICITRDSITGNAWQAGLNPKGYLWSASLTSATDAVLLAY
jgi:hypothetical protein